MRFEAIFAVASVAKPIMAIAYYAEASCLPLQAQITGHYLDFAKTIEGVQPDG